jgi:hypothetical protein
MRRPSRDELLEICGKQAPIKTVAVPIVELALGILHMDDLCPDVGMGMWESSALDEVLAKYGLTKDDVPYDELLDEIRVSRGGECGRR